MIKAVLDTNILVSALLVAESNPSRVLNLVLNGKVLICYDSRIMVEYKTVLSRPKFPFEKRDVGILLDTLMRIGVSVLSEPSEIHFADIKDKMFYEVAQSADAWLVTGNGRHFPKEKRVKSPAEFLERLSTAEANKQFL
jgi:putative PIN family toxin of toxin-antitoxin system